MAKQTQMTRKVHGAEKPEDYLDPKTGEHLIPKYETFCLDYAQHFAPKLALEAAGYPIKNKTEHQLQGAFRRVMARPDIRLRIRSLIREKADHAGIGQDWVVMRWMELLDRCMQKEQVLDNEGNPTGEWKFDSRGANNVLHDMATYFGMFQRQASEAKPVRININFGPSEKPPKQIEGEVIDG